LLLVLLLLLYAIYHCLYLPYRSFRACNKFLKSNGSHNLRSIKIYSIGNSEVIHSISDAQAIQMLRSELVTLGFVPHGVSLGSQRMRIALLDHSDITFELLALAADRNGIQGMLICVPDSFVFPVDCNYYWIPFATNSH
jgi:hypothetical protein